MLFFVSVPDAGENTLEVEPYGAAVSAGEAEAVKPVSPVPSAGAADLRKGSWTMRRRGGRTGRLGNSFRRPEARQLSLRRQTYDLFST